MRPRPAVLVLLTIAVLPVFALPAGAKNPPYLSQMPTVARVKAGIRGGDARDTAARRMGAFRQLQQVIEALAGPRYSRNQLTPDEKRLIGQYRVAYAVAAKPYAHLRDARSGAGRRDWYGLHASYETDPRYRQALLRQFCSPGLRALYAQATGRKPAAPAALVRAQAAVRAVPALALLLCLLLYFAPTLAAWLRGQSDSGHRVPLGLLFVLNLLFGSTGIGWLVLWPFALGWWKFPQRAGAARWAEGSPESQRLDAGPPIWGPGSAMPGPAERPPGPAWQKQDTGWESPEAFPGGGATSHVCPVCHGSRGKWVLPQTEQGTSEWEPCTYCNGSGHVQ